MKKIYLSIVLLFIVIILQTSKSHGQCNVITSISGGTDICAGTTICVTPTITGQGCIPGKWQYYWGDGSFDTSSCHTYANGGTYYMSLYTYVDSVGYFGDTIIFNVYKPSVTITSVNPSSQGLNDGTATAIPSGGKAPYNYMWSIGDTPKTITGLGAGSYSVCITDVLGCTACAGTTLQNPTGIITKSINNDGFQLFPNPSKGGSVYIQSNSTSNTAIKYSVVNSLGQIVVAKENVTIGNGSLLEIKTLDLPSGIYFVRLDLAERSTAIKLIVDK